MSLESLRFMLGGAIHRPAEEDAVIIHRTEEVVAGEDGKLPLPKDHITEKKLAPEATAGHPIRFINYGGGVDADGKPSGAAGGRTQIVYSASGVNKMTENCELTFNNKEMGITAQKPVKGDHIRIFWEEEVKGAANADTAVEVTISPETYPGTYKVIGDTFMRSQATGKDEAFQFVIGKAKVLSEVTLTLEAEGDPSTFEMTLNVLRSDNERGDKEMMKLIRYGAAADDASSEGNDIGSLTAASSGSGDIP